MLHNLEPATIPLQRLLPPHRPRREGARTTAAAEAAARALARTRPLPGGHTPRENLASNTDSTAETASPVPAHRPLSRSRLARAVHQLGAETPRSCGRSSTRAEALPQASHLHSTEAARRMRTRSPAFPDKPPESLTIRPCEQGRREADTDCRHNRKRNSRRRVQREQAAKSSTKVRQSSDMTRRPHQWQTP